jgi:hypothetical protein
LNNFKVNEQTGDWRHTRATGDILEQLDIYWSNWTYTGATGDILEQLDIYWSNWR